MCWRGSVELARRSTIQRTLTCLCGKRRKIIVVHLIGNGDVANNNKNNNTFYLKCTKTTTMVFRLVHSRRNTIGKKQKYARSLSRHAKNSPKYKMITSLQRVNYSTGTRRPMQTCRDLEWRHCYKATGSEKGAKCCGVNEHKKKILKI